LPGAALALPYGYPIGGFIARPFEMIAFNEGLHQMNGMCVFVPPIFPDTAHDTGKDVARHVWHADGGQDKEPALGGHEVDMFLPGFRIPANEGLTRLGLPGSGAEEQAGNIPAVTITNQILQVLSHGPIEAHLMVAREIVSNTGLLM